VWIWEEGEVCLVLAVVAASARAAFERTMEEGGAVSMVSTILAFFEEGIILSPLSSTGPAVAGIVSIVFVVVISDICSPASAENVAFSVSVLIGVTALMTGVGEVTSLAAASAVSMEGASASLVADSSFLAATLAWE
jgi:hypothetical protein